MKTVVRQITTRFRDPLQRHVVRRIHERVALCGWSGAQRALRSGAFIAFLISIMAGCADRSEPVDGAPLKVRVMIQPYLGNAPILIAKEEGYFAAQGLDVELVTMNAVDMAVPLLLNGELDVIAGALVPGILNAAARGIAIKAVAERGSYARDGCTRLAILTRPGLLEQYEGNGPPPLRRISLNPLPPMLYAVERVLAQAGVDLDTLESVHLPDAAEMEALRDGKIDAAFTGEPWLTRMLDAGAGDLWLRTEDALPGEAYGFSFYGPTFLERNPDAGRRWMIAYLEGVRRFQAGRTPETVELVARVTGEDPAMLARMCWPTFTADGRTDPAMIEAFQQWALEKELIEPAAAGVDLWDGSFVDAALKVLRDAPEQ